MSTSAFFSSDDAMTRKLDCESIRISDEEIDKVYEITHCVQWTKGNQFLSVALQFPDHLLADAPRVVKLIQDQVPESTIFILGDTSYGSCCVDEVGAQHYKADAIIHYGPACLSPTTRLPVFYVLGRATLSVTDCVTEICQQCTDTAMKAVLAYDTRYAYIVGEVFQQLKSCLPNLVLSKMNLLADSAVPSSQASIYDAVYPKTVHIHSDSDSLFSPEIRCGRAILLPAGNVIDDYSFIYLGDPNSPAITNLMMNFNKSPFFAYQSQTSACERITLNVNKSLMKRFYLIERAKDANIVGILVGTLGVAKYRDMMDQLKALIKKAGKKSYTFVVGKLNPQKLANFAEVDIFVMVSCPESCLLDQTDFHRPVVTPFEMEIACNPARQWTGHYTTDFSALLPGAAMHVESPQTDVVEEEADVSLISNRIRVMGQRALPDSPAQDVVLRSGEFTVATKAENASEFLSMRSWQGLEQKLGVTPVVKAVQGQAGIAASYTNEHDS